MLSAPLAVYGFFFAPATRPLLRCDAEPSSVARMQQVAAAAVEPSAAAESQPLRVDVSSTVTPEATMWCDPSFRLEAAGPACSRVDVGGIESSFMLKDVLTDAEAARMVAMAEKMGIERGGQAMSGTDEAERENGAVSWVLHKELIEQIFSRIAPHLPAHIAVHRPGTAAPENPGGAEKTWVREVAGAPEGIYTLSGLSARSRVYRYSAASDDAFSPHFDETWPGSDLHASAGRAPALSFDGWRYSRDADGAWAWSQGDRLSHLTVLLYLTDGFTGGETLLHEGPHDADGDLLAAAVAQMCGKTTAVAPVAGSVLCFPQSLRLGRPDVAQAPSSILHEGLPSKGPASKYVLRTDVSYTMPPPAGKPASEANLLDPQVGEALFDLSSDPAEREGQLTQLQRLLTKGDLPRGGPYEAAMATLRANGLGTSEWE